MKNLLKGAPPTFRQKHTLSNFDIEKARFL